MSNTNPLIAPPALLTPSEQAAGLILNVSAQQFSALLNRWTACMNAVWKNQAASPAQVLAALGANAGNAFALSSQTAAFLESLSPGCTSAVMASVKPTTKNTDGTVTLNS